MNIAIDLSPLQSPHRMRGIGYTLINFINNISDEERKQHFFIFFVSPPESTYFTGDPLDLLVLKGMTYEVRSIGYSKQRRSSKLNALGKLYYMFTKSRQHMQRMLPMKIQRLLNRLGRGYRSLRAFYFGDPRQQDLSNIDVYLQTDQSQSLPAKNSIKKALILYDIIPYVLESDYLWSYRTSRKYGLSRKRALVSKLRRWLYVHKVRLNTKNADYLLAISQHTKEDFVHYLTVPPAKIKVVPLGVSKPKNNTTNNPILHHYVKTSWGYIKRPLTLDSTVQFLLFVGGADRRRKLEDLVTAFNHLRARGQKTQTSLGWRHYAWP